MAGITVGILLTEQTETEKTFFSLLNKLVLNKNIDFLSAYIYNQETDESIEINSVSKWIEISCKTASYNQAEFMCDNTIFRIQLVKIEEKIGFEIYFPYTFFCTLYRLKEKNIELIRACASDICQTNSIDYLFFDFDENLELNKTDFQAKLMNEKCYYIFAMINNNNDLLEFASENKIY